MDIALAAVVFLVTWCVASEGAWNAAIIFLCTLFGGLLAMNFFEPLANFLESRVAGSWGHRWDVIALVGLFAGFTLLLRTMSEHLARHFIAVDSRLYDVFRWAFAGMTGYLTMAILLTALHTSPLPREFLGFKPERRNFFGIVAPDRQWLGFMQFLSEKSWRRGAEERVFDGPFGKIGSQEGRWPSFTIRYATRREELQSGVFGGSGRADQGLSRRGGSRKYRGPRDASDGTSF